MNNLITKNAFLKAIVCPRLGWLAHNGQLPEDDSLNSEFQYIQGNEINKRARKLFPSGVLISGAMQKAITETTSLISKNTVLFEPAFSADGFSTRADILCKDGDAWNLIEVKSGKDKEDENPKVQYIEDAAYTAMVLVRAGIEIKTISLMLISEDYRKGMPDNKLFVTTDITDNVKAKVNEFNVVANSLVSVLNNQKAPGSKLIVDCKKCDIFENCTGKGVNNHILYLPRISSKLFDELNGKGIYKIEDINPGIKLSDGQKRAWQVVCTNKPIISQGIEKELKKVIWPSWYLDFETFAVALPIYDDVAPHKAIVTQYSIHKCYAPCVEEEHFEYLADPSRDCRREVAENLIKTLEGNGSIIVYSSYEKGIINGLAETFPDLAAPLKKLIDRMFDLCAFLRTNYCHKDFKGSYSIKKVLPVIVPGLDYSDLEIREGGSAMVLFAYMAMGKITNTKEIAQIRKNLLAYCKRDTLAMVKLHEAVLKLI